MERIKASIRQCLPQKWQYALKRYYYPRVLRRFKESDWAYSGVVRLLVRPGDTVLDIGANVGYVSKLLAAMVGGVGHVHSVEPIPPTFDLLARNVRCLRLNNITTHNCGISSADGRAVMQVPDYQSGGGNFYEARIVADAKPEQSSRSFDVVLRSIDSLFPDESLSISFIKMDVEGHERPALQGGAELLARCKPALLVEVEGNPDDQDTEAAKLLDWLAGLGYLPYVLKDQRLLPRSENDQPVDYVFLCDQHLPFLRDVL